MKRSFLALLAALMLLTLTACGGSTTPPPVQPDSTANNTANDTDAANNIVDNTTDDVANADDSAVSDNAADDTMAESPDTSEEVKNDPSDIGGITRGIWNGSTYVNDSVSLRLTAPDGWVAATDEELAQLIGQGAEVMEVGTEAYEQAMAATIYDMGVSSSVTGDNVLVCFENVSETAALFSDNLTAEDYVSILKDQLASLSDPVYSFSDTVTLNLCGNEYLCLPAVATTQGIELPQYYIVRRQGDHMVCIICTSVSCTLDDFTALFN